MKAFSTLYLTFFKHLGDKIRYTVSLLLGVAVVGISAFAVSQGGTPEEGVDSLVVLALTVFVPVVSLLLSSSTLGQLKEDETLVYIWLSPVSRILIATSAWAAAATVAVPFTSIFSGLAFFIATDGEPRAAIGGFIAAALGTLAYSAAFVLLGAFTKRATIIGLVYLFLWENLLISGFWFSDMAVSKYSISHSVRSLAVRILDGTELESKLGYQFPTAFIVLVVLTTMFLCFAGWRLNKTEVV